MGPVKLDENFAWPMGFEEQYLLARYGNYSYKFGAHTKSTFKSWLFFVESKTSKSCQYSSWK